MLLCLSPLPSSLAIFELVFTLSSYKSLTATISTPSNFDIDFKCPLPLAPNPMKATLTVSNLGAEKSPMYLPLNLGGELALNLEAAVSAAAEIAVVFRNFLLL